MERGQPQRARLHSFFLEVFELPLVRDRAEAGQSAQHRARAGCKEDLGGVRHPANHAPRVVLVELVRDQRLLARAPDHTAARGIAHEQTCTGELRVRAELLLQTQPHPGERAGADPGDARRDFDHHVEGFVPIVDVERLQRAAPAVHVLVEVRADRRCRVDPQVTSELPRDVAECVVGQDRRRVDRAACDDDDLRTHGEVGHRLARRRFEQQRGHAGRAPVLDEDALRACVRVDRRARVLRARQVGQVHRQLRVRRAAERAHAAAAAAVDVAADRFAVQAELLHAAPEDARVLAEQLFGHRLHVLDALDAIEERLHRFGIYTGQAEIALPSLENSIGRAEARAGVDQRCAAEAHAHRHGDRR